MEYKNRTGEFILQLLLKLPIWMAEGILEGLGMIFDVSNRSAARRRRERTPMKHPRKKGLIRRTIEARLQRVNAWLPLQRLRKHAALRACEKLEKWAQKAESAGFCPEADLLRQTRRIVDGTDGAYNQAMLRILSRPSPPREYPDTDPETLLWSQGFLEICMRGILLDLPKEPGSNRKIIKWFFWAADLSAPDINFMSMMRRIYLVITPKGWQVLKFRNFGNFELGSLTKSVSRREFFQFQREFSAILEAVDLKFSGWLALTSSDPESKFDPDAPREQYKMDKLTFGDSNGRPRRHEIKILPVLPVKEAGASA